MREGLGDALRGELARTQPDLLSRLERYVPAMFPKAYRWIAEMEEIAAFAGSAGDGADIYHGAARLYERIAADFERGAAAGSLAALTEFCAKGR
jgi:L-threonate 2-dehydrogenase